MTTTDYIVSAHLHGDSAGSEYEADDLATFFAAAYLLLTPAQLKEFAVNESVREALAWKDA